MTDVLFSLVTFASLQFRGMRKQVSAPTAATAGVFGLGTLAVLKCGTSGRSL